MDKRLRAVILPLLVAVAVLLTSTFPALAALAGPAFSSTIIAKHFPMTATGQISPSGRVVVSRLPAPGSGTRPVRPLPFHPRDATAFAQAKENADAGVGPTLPGSDVPLAAARGPAAATPQILTSFPGVNLNQQSGWFGADQALAPPDTQIAAGPTYLTEMVNSSGSVWTKSGTLTKDFDLNSFFPVPSGYSFSDPRVLYDSPSGHWFASGLSFDASFNAQTYVAVSQTSDPTGSWWTYTVASNTSGVLYDQPKIGVSNDKLVISWNDYGNSGTSFTGQETYVLQKSALVTGAPVNWTNFGPDTTRFNVVPSQSLTSTDTEYLVFNDSSTYHTLGIVAITGTPTAGNVTWTEWDPSITATSSPPQAVQPGGPAIDTNDDRLLGAAWQNGILWTGGNTSCQPSGDTRSRSCLRLIQISTGGAAPSILQSFDVGSNGGYLYFPAITFDSNGDAIVVATYSSASTYASVDAATQTVGTTNAVGSLVTVISGLGPFNWCGTPSCSQNRWGDYSGAAPDPANPANVWVAGEYGASATIAYDWGTGIGELTIPATPTPTSSATRTSTPTSTRTATVTPTKTITLTSTITPTGTVTVTSTVTPMITNSPTKTPTFTPTSTGTPSPNNTSTPTKTPTSTSTRQTYRVYLPLVYGQ